MRNNNDNVLFLPHCFSSLPSLQSTIPLHTKCLFKQVPSAHWKFPGHPFSMHPISSEPSEQSFMESHLDERLMQADPRFDVPFKH